MQRPKSKREVIGGHMYKRGRRKEKGDYGRSGKVIILSFTEREETHMGCPVGSRGQKVDGDWKTKRSRLGT